MIQPEGPEAEPSRCPLTWPGISDCEPALPQPDAQGHYPAVEAMRVLIARDIIRDRRRLGLSQAELARRAGVRPETLCRVERGDRSPSIATVEKIDRALSEAGGMIVNAGQ